MDLFKGLLKDSKTFVGYCVDKCKEHGLVEVRRQKMTNGLVMVVYNVVQHPTKGSEALINAWNNLWTDGFVKTYTVTTFPFNVIFSLELDKTIIGVCGYNKYENVIHLHSLAIAKTHIKKGFARGFCECLLEYSRTEGDYMLAGVTVNMPKWLPAFYESLGFEYVDDTDVRFGCCLEYKYPRIFSGQPLQWMFQNKDMRSSFSK